MITNTTMLGAVSGATGVVTIDSIVAVVRERFTGKLADNNERAVRDAFKLVGGK